MLSKCIKRVIAENSGLKDCLPDIEIEPSELSVPCFGWELCHAVMTAFHWCCGNTPFHNRI